MKLAANLMRKWGWNRSHHDNWITGRLYSLATYRRPWWDWGHRLVILVGTSWGGSYQEPKPPTWWYVPGPHKRMARTGYPRRRYEIVTSYDEHKARTVGLTEDQAYEWRAICFGQDGDLQLGRRYWGEPFYGLDYAEQRIVARYLRKWRRKDWWGLRTWLYHQGLYASVHAHKPFSCGQVPPRGSGGYDHWHCRERRGHDGLHRHNNYVWGEIDGEPIGCTLAPAHHP